MNTTVADPEPSPSTASTSAVTGTSDSFAPEPITPGSTTNSNTRYSSITQTDHDMPIQGQNGVVRPATNPSRNGLNRGPSMPRAGSPAAMEIDDNGDSEIVETPSSHSRIPATYHNLPVTHYFIAPPAALPYPRSPVRQFPEGHPLYTRPSAFSHLPRAPPHSPSLDPLQILELESARERNEWEQVCKDLGRPRLERPSITIAPPQPPSVVPNVPQTQTQVNGNTNKATSQATPSDDGYDSDSSDVELRIYNADPADETQASNHADSALGAQPPTPLGARPPPTQLLAKPNGSAAHRSILERLSQGPNAPKTSGVAPETTADRPGSAPPSNTTTPAKRKIDDVDLAAPESSAKRKSPASQQPPADSNEWTRAPPPLRAEVDRVPKSSTPQAPPRTSQTSVSQVPSQAATPQPTATSSSSTVALAAKSGNICRFHNRPPGRVCVRKDQCPDLHIGELQKSTPGVSPTPFSATEPPPPSNVVPPVSAPPVTTPAVAAPPVAPVAPPVIAPPLSRTPSLANAPPLGTNLPPPPHPTRPPCRYFFKNGCHRANCPFPHTLDGQTSQPASRQLAPSPIPATSAAKTTSAPIPVHIGPKAPFPKTTVPSSSAHATAGPSVPPAPVAPITVAPSIPPPTLFAPAPTPVAQPAPPPIAPLQPVGTTRFAQSTSTHPLPAKPTAATTSVATSPKASTTQGKGKGKGKGKTVQATPGTPPTPTYANKPSAPSNANPAGAQANVRVKPEPETPVLNIKAAERKASESQPKPQPPPLTTATREIKQEEVTLYDLADDSPQEPSGSSVLPPELVGSQPGPGTQAQAHSQSRPEATQVQPRAEVGQPQPRPIAPLPTRAAPPTAAPNGTSIPAPASTALPPLNRPPPPPYRPPPPSTSARASPTSATPAPATAVPPAPTVPTTSVIPPTPVRPALEQSAPKLPAANGPNGPATNKSRVPASNAPTTNTPAVQATNASKVPPSVSQPPPPLAPAATVSTDRLSIPVPPRSNPSPAPLRLDVAPDSSPPQALTQPRARSRQTSREPVRPDSRGLARRMSPEPVRRNSRDAPRRNSREPERRTLMTRLDSRSAGSNSYRPARSRSPPPRRYSPPPRRRSPPPRGRSPSPVRYRDWRSRSRSPVRRPLRERFGPRGGGPARRSRSRSWSPVGYSRSPSRSPMYRSPRSFSRSFSRSRSSSPPRQRYEPRPAASADAYTNGSAYFPAEKNIPRAWEPQAEGSRSAQKEGYNSSPDETMVIVDEPIRSSTPPPRNAIAALNDYDSFNQSRMMDISPMSSPARGHPGGGLGNRISDYTPPAADDYSTPMANGYPSEQREGLLTRMAVEPDLANRLAPANNRGQAPNRVPPTSKPSKARTQAQQAPLANRLAAGDPYPNQASRNERPVRGGRLMGRMTGQ